MSVQPVKHGNTVQVSMILDLHALTTEADAQIGM